jgi:hypothetical protein
VAFRVRQIADGLSNRCSPSWCWIGWQCKTFAGAEKKQSTPVLRHTKVRRVEHLVVAFYRVAAKTKSINDFL